MVWKIIYFEKLYKLNICWTVSNNFLLHIALLLVLYLFAILYCTALHIKYYILPPFCTIRNRHLMYRVPLTWTRHHVGCALCPIRSPSFIAVVFDLSLLNTSFGTNDNDNSISNKRIWSSHFTSHYSILHSTNLPSRHRPSHNCGVLLNLIYICCLLSLSSHQCQTHNQRCEGRASGNWIKNYFPHSFFTKPAAFNAISISHSDRYQIMQTLNRRGNSRIN